MKESDLKQIKIGDELYVTGNTRRRGQSGTVIFNNGHYVKLVFKDDTVEMYSHYVVQREPITEKPKKPSYKDMFIEDLYLILKGEFEFVPCYKLNNIVDKLVKKGWKFRRHKGSERKDERIHDNFRHTKTI